MSKKSNYDPDEQALLEWCMEVEELLIAGGATRRQAQEYIEEEAEWFTDMYYDGLSPDEAAQQAFE